ncbi:MAG: glycosyltransferase family 52 protein [Lachnospiraceae bacterium]|nr:glycosyltransferase family 52 protein [Lachnospiraceae bacterium]
MHDRIYVCHTFYHVYVTCLKELDIRRRADRGEIQTPGTASLVLSLMSNRFGSLKDRAVASRIFEDVFEYDEKPDTYFEELVPLKTDTGNIVRNMINRIRFTKRLGQLQEEYIPVDFKDYRDIYVFCDSDPIGYYLNYIKIRYHALEDGLNCILYGDQARVDNNGHFKLKAFLSSTGLIFIQNGWGRYCIDMEVNDLSVIEYPCPKYIEVPRRPLQESLTSDDRELILGIFLENADEVRTKLKTASGRKKVMILSEPLCDLETRAKIFKDIMNAYGSIDGEETDIIIKQHPRDYLDYSPIFPEAMILPGTFPMEMLNFMPELHVDRLVSVFTVLDALEFADEKVFLGYDFMDRYEAPEIHRLNDQIVDS